MNAERIQYSPVPWREVVRFGHPNVRLAHPDETLQIWDMVRRKSLEKDSTVLARPYEEVEKNISSIVVYEENNEILGCAAVEQYDAEHGEIRMVVSNKKGIGKILVPEAVNFSKLVGLSEVFLTTSIPKYFLNLDVGFYAMKRWKRMVWRNPNEIPAEELLPIPCRQGRGVIDDAKEEDVPDILIHLQEEMESEEIMRWDEQSLKKHIHSFLVYRAPEGIIATIALLPYGTRIMEAVACVVAKKHRGKGIGTIMVQAGDTRIVQSGIQQVFMAVSNGQKKFMKQCGYSDDKVGKDVLWLTNYEKQNTDRE